ncbi:4'-phosphopantetheinyl transferase family protein [Thiocystis violacea]|uniref:4'-phosphopantetheinyl transferase family protein n=1 Tax=Thiocystis violacea TaxID=13725 RepID=UPI0019066B18|nr:4'-phosphopantetheinyl transferase superfamily protein [Thiocystis violacea]MBK1720654.1 4-phosphopantetheinyl transferase [Thiocystis violacea]
MTWLEWQPSSDTQDLQWGDIHLWKIRADERGLEPALGLDYLDARQRARAQRMRHAHHRDRYVRAQAGLRIVLAGYLRCAPEEIAFRHGPAGKPYVADAAETLSFNLTTTGDLALVGLSTGNGAEHELGVDCEWIRPRGDLLGVARRMFEPQVVQALEETPEPERLDSFYRAWTALEADAKADGRGLFRPRPADARRPVVLHCIPEPGYIAAIARATLPPVASWKAFHLDGA